MKKLRNILLTIVLLPVVLIVLLAAALYYPPIQNWAVQKATAYASEQTGMQISIDNVRLSFALDLQVNGVKVIKPAATPNAVPDTIADIHSLNVDVQLRPLFEGKVMVDELNFNYMKLNTTDFIKAAHVKGQLKSLNIASHGIDLKKEFVRLDKAFLDGADVNILLADSVPEDTTETKLFWKIQADLAKVSNSKIRVKGKGMDIATDIKELKAEEGFFDLGKSEYKVTHAELLKSDLSYAPQVSLSDITAIVDSIYFCPPDISAQIAHMKLKENGYGATVKDLQAKVSIDSTSIHVNDFRMETPYSDVKLGLNMQMNAFDSNNPGNLQLALSGNIGKGDISLFRQFMPKGIVEKLPNQQIAINGAINGNLKNMKVEQLGIKIPGKFSFTADGNINNPHATLDNPFDLNRTNLDINANLDCPNIDFLTQFVDPKILAGTGFKMPHGLPLNASVKLHGNMQNLALENLNLKIPGKINLVAKGEVLRLNNINNLSNLQNISLNFDVPNIDFLLNCIDPKLLAGTGIKIPHGIGVKGTAGIKGNGYIFDLIANEGGGWLKLKGTFNPERKEYDVDAQAHQLAVNHFMPSLGIGKVTASAIVNGHGFDFFSKATRLNTKANIQSLAYDRYNLTNVKLDAKIANGNANAYIDSNNDYLRGNLDVSALMSTKVLNATIGGDIARINFQKLGITEMPLSMTLCSHIDVDYDFHNNLQVKGLVSDISILEKDRRFRPDDITLNILSTRDTTRAIIDCGDLYGHLEARGGYNTLLGKVEKLQKIIGEDLKKQRIDIEHIWAELPLAKLDLKAGRENPLSRFINYNGLNFQDAEIHLASTPLYGINGNLQLCELNVDSVLLDTLRLKLKSDESTCEYSGQIRNSKDNPQFIFNSLFHGKLTEHGAQANVSIFDSKDKLGIQVGANAKLVEEGVRMELMNDEDIILGYQNFRVNSNNYLLLGNNNRLSADMKLRSSDGRGIGIYTNDENTSVEQDITLTVAKLDLKEILSAIPYAPDIRGILDGDFHYVQEEDKFSVSSSSGINHLNYAGLNIGNLSSDFVYMPEDNGGHHIDGVLYMDDKEIAAVVGSYNPAGEGAIDASIELTEMPMHVANGFIPNQLFGFKGKGDGELEITGTLAKPHVNGEIFLDSCHLYSTPYGVDLRFSNDPVLIKDSRLLLENFEIYANNDNPLNIAGYIDFANISKMYMDVRMKAENYGIIDAKENPRSEAYGKAYVDFVGTMKGYMNNLTMKGKLDILPSTNMAYILRDSPLTTDNHLDDLVKFVNKADTTDNIRVKKPDLYGFNMDMNINFISGMQCMTYLNTDHSNYVDISGNGQLRMTYSPADKIKLTGRYNLAGGEMKYSLPIIPLKTFNIKDGSYVEFMGDMMNPRLNITATELNKAQVDNGSAGGARTVEFECGIIITKTLQNMGLEFTLDAPRDLAMKTDLATMSPEMRGKLAVTMLTTGMYLAEGNTSTFTMNTALSQFLQSEINNITGNALRTLDLSIGLDNQVDKSGNFHTDYSFKFAKRFLNNRLKVSIGGKVSTGESMDKNQNSSVFDNVELEYRLDDGGQKFLNLYYDNNSYDWLDGNTQEFGGGFIWRRSVLNFKDLFDFLHKNKKDTIKNSEMPIIDPDSVTVSEPK
ncbi:MAG: translocation/assembly module TamB domain-containing protein [Bacteroidaceae bacterium]|nr:translocation/assembly module TamB domain-containing protein [Bacteroidaceae bacterium]